LNHDALEVAIVNYYHSDRTTAPNDGEVLSLCKSFLQSYITAEQEGRGNIPPLGLMPCHIWREKRAKDIIHAIERYMHVNKLVPARWIRELEELCAKGEIEGDKEATAAAEALLNK
jgi:hypothetical protein